MSKRVESNVRGRLLARGAALLLPAAFSLFALAGVTARPAMSIAEAKVELAAARARADELQLESERLHAFEEANGFELAAAGVERARSPIPEAIDPVQVYGLLRVSAESNRIELVSMHLGAEADLGLDGPYDRIVATDVAVSGNASLTALVSFVDTLRALGLPAAVRDVSINRTSPAESEFHFRMTLGLIHFAPYEETDEFDMDDEYVDDEGEPEEEA